MHPRQTGMVVNASMTDRNGDECIHDRQELKISILRQNVAYIPITDENSDVSTLERLGLLTCVHK